MIKLSDIATIASSRAEKRAIVSPDYTVSWRALELLVNNMITALRCKFDTDQIKQAVFVSDNRAELVMIMAAFSTQGIPLSGVDYTLEPETALRAMRAIGADFLIVASSSMGLERTRALVRAAGCPVIDLDNAVEGAMPLSTLLLPHDDTWDEDAISHAAKRPFRSVLFTSGTSGDPKPVVRHRSIDARRFAYFTQRYGFNSMDRYLVTIPLYHVAGSGWARNFMSLGATLYLGPVNQPDVLSDMIIRHKITATVTTPINLTGIISKLLADENEPEHALRFVLVGGKNFSPTQKRHAIKTLGPVVYEYYGSTETGVNTIAEPEDLLHHPHSVGRPYSGNQVVVIDGQARVVSPGVAGQVAVSSYLMMDHYADGSANDIHIDGARFMVTPDRGCLDENGRLYVFNRSSGKDGDLDVYTVEDRLRYIAGIKDVAIMMGAGRQSGQRRTGDCALVLKSGHDDDGNVIEIASKVLENAGIDCRRVRVVPKIPYSLSGKVRWNDLDLMLDGNPSGFTQAA